MRVTGTFGVITSIDRTRLTMTRMIFVAAAALGSLACGLQPAAADEASWCAVSKDGDHWNCQYRSIEECRPSVLAGNRGWCNPNPYFVANPTEHRRSAKGHARPQ
jgi:Protein of unknown function (DUF3551)